MLAPYVADSIWFNATSIGLGSFVVASAVAGYRTPATAGVPNGALVHYSARTATEFENGEGIYSSGTVTLTRVTIFASSNANAKVNFAAVPTVAIAPLGEDTNAGAIMPAQFGAVGDGSVDDTAALNSFFASFVAGGSYLIPKGTYRFTSALNIPATNNYRLRGDSQGQTKLNYNGASTTIDLLTVGTAVAVSHSYEFSDITVSSDTTMTAGIAMRIYRAEMGKFRNLGADSVLYGIGKLWHGIRFEMFHVIYVDGVEAFVQRDGLQVVGSTTVTGADLLLHDLNIASCRVGVRVGGGADNVHLVSGNVQSCDGEGVSIDQTIVNDVNFYTFLGRHFVVGDNCAVAGVGQAGVLVDEATTGGNASRKIFDGYYSGTQDNKPGIYLKTVNQQQVIINGTVQGNAGGGVKNDSTNSFVQITSNAEVRGNLGAGFNNSGNSVFVRGNQANIEANSWPWSGTRSQRRSKFGPDDTTLFVRANLGTFTVTIASPAVFTKASHGLQIDDPVVFSTTGALPTGLTPGTTYYVIAAGFTTGVFRVSATLVPGGGGTVVNTTGTQSGTHSVSVGNDDWDGSAAARGSSFLSIQGALNYLFGNIDLQTSDITIQCADGVYLGGASVNGPHSGNGTIRLNGNTTTPANCLISLSNNYGVNTYGGGRLDVGGFKFVITGSGAGVYATEGSLIRLVGKCDFGACAWYAVFADTHGRVISSGIAHNISGGGLGFIAADNIAFIKMTGAAIVTSNTPAWSLAFANCWDNSQVQVDGLTFSGTGGTGKRFDVTSGGVIYTNGAGTSYLPGNAAGTGTNTGAAPWGLYL